MNVMSSSKTVVCLSVVVLLQLMVLAAEFGTTVYPLYTGEKVALVVAPVDPRSLFRGQYVQVRYDISQVDPA